MAHHPNFHLLELLRVRSKTATLGYGSKSVGKEESLINKYFMVSQNIYSFPRAKRGDEKELLRKARVGPAQGRRADSPHPGCVWSGPSQQCIRAQQSVLSLLLQS